MEFKKEDFFPDVFETTLQKSGNVISEECLEELILYVSSNSGLPKIVCGVLVRLFFNEIRLIILEGKDIRLPGFGRFWFNKNDQFMIKVTFKAEKYLIKHLNGQS